VDVQTLGGGSGRFSVPSGASKGRFEAVELRDGDGRRFLGKGVLKALRNVRRTLGPGVRGMDSRGQDKIDQKLLRLDGTRNKDRLGANAVLGVSVAVARANADTAGVPFFRSVERGGCCPFP